MSAILDGDYVKVVRCKMCEDYEPNFNPYCPRELYEDVDDGWCCRFSVPIHPNGYCCFGYPRSPDEDEDDE